MLLPSKLSAYSTYLRTHTLLGCIVDTYVHVCTAIPSNPLPHLSFYCELWAVLPPFRQHQFKEVTPVAAVCHVYAVTNVLS